MENDLLKITINNFPEILDNNSRLKAILKDVYKENTSLINLMMILYENEILRLFLKGSITETIKYQYIYNISSLYGLRSDKVNEAFEEWVLVLNLKTIKKYCKYKKINLKKEFSLFSTDNNIKKRINHKTIIILIIIFIFISLIFFTIYNYKRLNNYTQLTRNGWEKNDNNWFFYKNGEKVFNEIINDDGELYFLNNQGIMEKSKWIKYKNNDYYVNENGAIVKNNWIEKNDKWTFIGDDGKLVKNNWIEYENETYKLDKNGYLEKNRWITDGQYKYHVDSDGKMEKNKWVDGCYLGNSGYVLTDTVTPDGKTVDKNGYEIIPTTQNTNITSSVEIETENKIVEEEIINSYLMERAGDYALEKIILKEVVKVLNRGDIRYSIYSNNWNWYCIFYRYIDNNTYMVCGYVTIGTSDLYVFMQSDANGKIINSNSFANLAISASDTENIISAKNFSNYLISNNLKIDSSINDAILKEIAKKYIE